MIVTADRCGGDLDSAVTLREWVSLADFDSEHFVAQLVERLAWAVGDAQGSDRSASREQGHAVSARPVARPWTSP